MEQDSINRLIAIVKTIPEFEDDLDETASPTGWVTCRFCEGGGHRDGRKNNPIEHQPDCILFLALQEIK